MQQTIHISLSSPLSATGDKEQKANQQLALVKSSLLDPQNLGLDQDRLRKPFISKQSFLEVLLALLFS